MGIAPRGPTLRLLHPTERLRLKVYGASTFMRENRATCEKRMEPKMEKKYQVFVSSTYEDLRVERQQVIQALLELDCIPSGMELFPAANEDQWSLIRDVIDECDYYIVILAGRYGSTDPDGVGFTEKEYRYALQSDKPIIGFLHRDIGSLPQNVCEATSEGQDKLKEFRALVGSKMCKMWGSPEELGSVVSRSLVNLQRRHPGVGWVRGDVTTDKEASLQIVKLNKEIERLRSELDLVATQAPPGTEKLAQGDNSFELNFSFRARSRRQRGAYYDFTEVMVTTWNQIFYEISPLLIHEATDADIRSKMNQFIYAQMHVEVSVQEHMVSDEDINEDALSNFSIDENDFQTVKVQLRALGLIAKSEKNRSVKDSKGYWTLTPYGDHVMNQLRAIKCNPLDDLL